MLPWPEMLRAALSAGVPISEFWTLSMREWRWLAAEGETVNLSYQGLTKLMKIFPDKDENNGRI